MLAIEGLSKTFWRRLSTRGRRTGQDPAADKLQAVQDLNLTVQRGDIFGFLGPNGAGKSTTIRMVLGLIHPTAGRVTIGGHDLSTSRMDALKKVGAFVEFPAFYSYLTGRRNLEIFAGLSGPVSRGQVEEVLERVGLRGRADEPVRVYSHGMRARLGIAGCLLPRPELLVLDEPTDGLDPHGIREIRELLVRLAREEGMAVFLSSHLLGEVENLCNRIAVLERGRAILQGELAELASCHRRLRIESARPLEASAWLRSRFGLEPTLAVEAGHSAPQAESLAHGTFWVMPKGLPAETLNQALVQAGFAVRAIALEEGWLDRLFLEQTTSRESSLRRPLKKAAPGSP